MQGVHTHYREYEGTPRLLWARSYRHGFTSRIARSRTGGRQPVERKPDSLELGSRCRTIMHLVQGYMRKAHSNFKYEPLMNQIRTIVQCIWYTYIIFISYVIKILCNHYLCSHCICNSSYRYPAAYVRPVLIWKLFEFISFLGVSIITRYCGMAAWGWGGRSTWSWAYAWLL